jgi:hypothetical protein
MVCSAGTLLLLVIDAIPVPPCPEIDWELDVDPATPTPVPAAVVDWAHAGPVAAIATMAASNCRFMCGSPRAGTVKFHNRIHNRPPTAHEERRGSLFLLFTKRTAPVNSAIDSIYLNF